MKINRTEDKVFSCARIESIESKAESRHELGCGFNKYVNNASQTGDLDDKASKVDFSEHKISGPSFVVMIKLKEGRSIFESV